MLTCTPLPIWELPFGFADTALGCNSQGIYGATQPGVDPEPADLQNTPLLLTSRSVASSLALASEQDPQPHLWTSEPYGLTSSSQTNLADILPGGSNISTNGAFVSALPAGTSTGLFRFHALRLNSTVDCGIVSEAEYPETCPGQTPFLGNYSREGALIRFCVPGQYNVSPWTTSRDRQDITEEAWVQSSVANDSVLWDAPGTHTENFTIRCQVNSTRGYFELPNDFNGNIPGPLLKTWPSQAVLANDFSDIMSIYGLGRAGLPSEK